MTYYTWPGNKYGLETGFLSEGSILNLQKPEKKITASDSLTAEVDILGVIF
jgi:hypothetical protein